MDRESIRYNLIQSYKAVRGYTEILCQPLKVEDFTVQAMDDVSPPKWHLGHVTWFFEKMVLQPFSAGYQVFNPHYNYLFNSYYESIGDRQPRPHRGLLFRPELGEIKSYRAYVDRFILELIESVAPEVLEQIGPIIEIGMAHEEQHQELFLTDTKYNFFSNPLLPTYSDSFSELPSSNREDTHMIKEGIYEIGYDQDGFSYDNESPRHKVYLHGFEIEKSLVTNGEYREFIEEGGYSNFTYWLSEGWAAIHKQGLKHPLYWLPTEHGYEHFTLNGVAPLDPTAPVSHLSYFEAAAFAAYRGCRLPTEAEWEVACSQLKGEGDFFGRVWQWTSSSYEGYPGYEAFQGALSEYNGKFMCGQYVLRGSSYLTSRGHSRSSYRNFFYPKDRWQVSGLRLIKGRT